jgi:hypothetical protein
MVTLDDRQLKDYMARYRAKVAETINALPPHADFVKQYCPANEAVWNFAK